MDGALNVKWVKIGVNVIDSEVPIFKRKFIRFILLLKKTLIAKSHYKTQEVNDSIEV